MKDGKTEYLQMIQEPICRMSTISAIFKGFAATIVAGIATLTYTDVNTLVLFLSFIPVLSFAMLDIYYCSWKRNTDFCMNKYEKMHMMWIFLWIYNVIKKLLRRE